jgi:alkylhydroperoxidase family enzyme
MRRIEIPDPAAIGDLPPDLEQAARSGALINVFRMMLRSPQIASAVVSLGATQFGTSSLAPVDRELAILAAGASFQAPYEASQHAPISASVGVTDAQRTAIAERRYDSAEFSAPQQALLRFVADVAASPTVTDEVFAAVSAHYSQQQRGSSTSSFRPATTSSSAGSPRSWTCPLTHRPMRGSSTPACP